jgi:hypothetical protein
VLKLAAGSGIQSVLPFGFAYDGVSWVDQLGGVAVDVTGNVYVTDSSRVLKLAVA